MADEKAAFEISASIAKVNVEKRLVFGIFSVAKVGDSLVVDGEGDRIAPDELEKAAYDYVLNARIAGENHVRKGVGQLVESMVITQEKLDAISKGLAASGIVAKFDVPATLWWGGFYVTDDAVLKACADGTFAGFSIGGSATRIKGD